MLRSCPGAHRFPEGGVFLTPRSEHAGIRDLARLAAAASRFLEGREADDDVRTLIRVGSGPGGAQLKAWVRNALGVREFEASR